MLGSYTSSGDSTKWGPIPWAVVDKPLCQVTEEPDAQYSHSYVVRVSMGRYASMRKGIIFGFDYFLGILTQSNFKLGTLDFVPCI